MLPPIHAAGLGIRVVRDIDIGIWGWFQNLQEQAEMCSFSEINSGEDGMYGSAYCSSFSAAMNRSCSMSRAASGSATRRYVHLQAQTVREAMERA